MRQFGAGIVAGLAFVVVQLLARLIAGIPTVVEVIQDQLVLLLPGPVFSFVLDRLLYLGKPLFFGELLVAVVVVLGGLGVVAIRSREPVVVAAALWLLLGLVELVVTGKGLFGGRADLALAGLISFGAYALVLLALGTVDQPSRRANATSNVSPSSRWSDVLRDRREVVSGGISPFWPSRSAARSSARSRRCRPEGPVAGREEVPVGRRRRAGPVSPLPVYPRGSPPYQISTSCLRISSIRNWMAHPGA